jgi:hypothetical protein
MPLVPFGEHLPDLPPRDNPGALQADGVVPWLGAYRPWKALATTTNALTARCQGAGSFRDLSGGTHNFAGDATKLYKLDSTGLLWQDVSRVVGGAYATDTANAWSFSQNGNVIIAVNGTDNPQAYTLGSSTNFALLAGTPPIGRFTCTIKDFSVIARVASLFNEVRWSAIGSPIDWTVSAVTQSDFQDIAHGGFVMGIVGGESGVVLQRNAITRMTYIGAEFIFQFDMISNSIGCMAENSLAAYQNNCFFLSDNGFYQLIGAQQLVPIGEGKINRTTLGEIDTANLGRVVGSIDPQNQLYIVMYPTTGGNGTPTKGRIYHWPTQRWSQFTQSSEWIWPIFSQSGYTLDGLDAVSTNLDLLSAPLDSPLWAGSGQYLLAGFFTDHKSGSFTGSNLAATIDTGEFEANPGKRTVFRSVRPIVDATGATITPITRNLPSDAVTTGSAISMDALGRAQMRVNARYARMRLSMAAGHTATLLQGLDSIDAIPLATR